MILGAGFGSRMIPLTRERPKPLLPVGNKPLLAQIAGVLSSSGERHAVINSHWMSDYLCSNIKELDVTFNVSNETSILGVAGGISNARRLLQAPVAIWNGDIWIRNPPLEELRSAAVSNGAICLAVAPASGQGTVGLNSHGCVVRLRGESYGEEVRSADYIGLCGLSQRGLSEMPAEGCLIGDFCMPRLRAGKAVQTLWVQEPWLDIGSLRGYLLANMVWLEAAGDLDGNYIDPSAHLAPEVQLRRSVVGANATVRGSGTLQDCVIWPDAQALAPLERSIVTPQCVVTVEGISEKPTPRT